MFEGIMEESFSNAKLQLQVTHDVRAFNRCKKREVLGAVSIQHLSFCDSVCLHFLPFPSVSISLAVFLLNLIRKH